MFQRHLPERHSGVSITYDLLAVNIQWLPANPPPFQFRSPHSSPNALDDKISFEFRNRADDDDHGSTKRSTSIDVFAEAHELNPKMIQFIEHFQKMPHASGHSVECGHEHDIEFASPSISH